MYVFDILNHLDCGCNI